MLRKYFFAISVLATLASIGCGGRVASDSPTRGEGDIPVGRVRIAPGRSATVRIDSVAGTFSTIVTGNATVVAPSQPFGPATLTIQPDSDDLLATSIPIQFGMSQQFVFNAEVQQRSAATAVDSLQIELMGSPVNVGQSRNIRVIVNGKNVGNVRPSIWIDGGVGMLDNGFRFVATSPGEGVVHAELLGVHTSIPVTVAP
ncbi:MAG: hypothetical protein K1X67_18695 [Fimbriimonadaceae bacterium]|nr:hypothetical protein [Fimbriimonadaceae bacterium]